MIEELIIGNLMSNERYSRKVLPFLDSAYFHSKHHKVVFELVSKHIDKYNELPTKSSMLVDLEKEEKLSHQDFKVLLSMVLTWLIW